MIPYVLLGGAGLLAWLLASRGAGTPSTAGDGDLIAEGKRWRPAALATPPPTAALAAAMLSRSPWVRDGSWAVANGVLYYMVS